MPTRIDFALCRLLESVICSHAKSTFHRLRGLRELISQQTVKIWVEKSRWVLESTLCQSATFLLCDSKKCLPGTFHSTLHDFSSCDFEGVKQGKRLSAPYMSLPRFQCDFSSFVLILAHTITFDDHLAISTLVEV